MAAAAATTTTTATSTMGRAQDWSSTAAILSSGRHFTDEHGRTLILRGVNLSGNSKLPTVHADSIANHRSVSFVGRPFALDQCDEHFSRLRSWGLTFIRLLVTWESLEHSGPGIYDEEYIKYLIKVIRKAGKFGLRCFIDPHQDTWSRFSGGSGAPGWTFELVNFNMANFQACGAAHINDFSVFSNERHMMWPTNYTKLASATMFTLFFGGRIFAPRCLAPDGTNVQDFMQRHFIAAFAHLASRLKNISTVVGFEVMNEPHYGYIGLESILKFNPLTQLHFGAFPNALESFALGNGMRVQVDNYVKSWPHPTRRSGKVWLNEGMVSAWAPGHECIWKQHGVWTVDEQNRPIALDPKYFAKNPSTSAPVDFGRDCYVPFIKAYTDAIKAVKSDYMVFFEPIPNEDPPEISEDVKSVPGLIYAPHWYDLKTLFSKSFDGYITHDVQGLSRGTKNILAATYFGITGAKSNYHGQLQNIVNTGIARCGARPIVVGECGGPMDMNEKRAFETGDYGLHTSFLDACLSAMESNLVSFTLWNYNPMNTNSHGDFWNGEDFSIYSSNPTRSLSTATSASSLASLVANAQPLAGTTTSKEATSPTTEGARPNGSSSNQANQTSVGANERQKRGKTRLKDITADLVPPTLDTAAVTAAVDVDGTHLGAYDNSRRRSSLRLTPHEERMSIPATPFDITSFHFQEDAEATADPHERNSSETIVSSASNGNLASFHGHIVGPSGGGGGGGSASLIEGHRGHDQHRGGRALDAVIRPYASKIAGTPTTSRFDLRTLRYRLEFVSVEHDGGRGEESQVRRTTEIFVPNFQYHGLPLSVEVSGGTWRHDVGLQTIWWERPSGPGKHWISIAAADGVESKSKRKGLSCCCVIL